MQQLDASLDAAFALELPHYSVYSLKVEENTPFHTWYENGQLALPDEETELHMYERIMERMEQNGYKQYEISNFALEGYEGRHNLTYWRNESYYGFGAGAHGYHNGVRHVNIAGVRPYIEAAQKGLPRSEERAIGRAEAMEDFMIVGLRVLDGVDRRHFYRQFDCDLEPIFRDPLEKGLELGLLEATKSGYRLTRKGLIYGNEVFASFLGEAEKADAADISY